MQVFHFVDLIISSSRMIILDNQARQQTSIQSFAHQSQVSSGTVQNNHPTINSSMPNNFYDRPYYYFT